MEIVVHFPVEAT